MTDVSVEQDRIEQDLARTRQRMDSRLSDLQDRLSPGQVVDDLMAYFRGSESGDFARNLMASVRANPLPRCVDRHRSYVADGLQSPARRFKRRRP